MLQVLAILYVEEDAVTPLLVGRFLFGHPSVRISNQSYRHWLRIFVSHEVIFSTKIFQVATEAFFLNEIALSESQAPAVATIGLTPLGLAHEIKSIHQPFEPSIVGCLAVITRIANNKVIAFCAFTG